MLKISWKVGDMFSFKFGYGIVLDNNKALLVTGGSINGYTITKGRIPKESQPRSNSIPYEVRLALWGAAVATETVKLVVTCDSIK